MNQNNEDRRVFYVDVGDMTAEEARKAIEKIKEDIENSKAQ